MSEQQKDAAQRWLEVFNTGDVDVLDELAAPGWVDHDPYNPFASEGVEGAKKTIAMYRAGFSDLHISIDDVIAEGDRVVVRWTIGGTHDGEIAGVPATGNTGSSAGISIARFEDGKIAETWAQWDVLNYLQTIGAAAAGEPAPAA